MSPVDKNLFYKCNKTFLIVLKCLGIGPYISEKNINSKIFPEVKYIYPLCLLIFFIFRLFLICYWFSYNTHIGRSIVNICYILYIVCESIIPILTISQGKYLNLIKHILKQEKLEEKLDKLGITFPFEWWYHVTKKTYLCVLATYVLLFLYEYYIFFIIEQEFDFYFINTSVILWILNCITEIYNVSLQTLFILAVLKTQKKFALLSLALSRIYELRNLKINANKSLKIQVQPFGMTLKQQILLIRDCHSSLCISTKLINEIGSTINLLKITQNTLMCLISFYIYLLGIIAIMQGVPVNWQLTSYISIIAFRNISGFLAVTIICANCSNQGNDFGCMVTKLINSGKFMDVLKELQDFSLQLLHTKISFTACDFFVINHTLFYEIAATIATYLFIILQFENSRNQVITYLKNFEEK